MEEKRKEEEREKKKEKVFREKNGNAVSCCDLCVCFGLRKVNMYRLVKVRYLGEDFSFPTRMYSKGTCLESRSGVWYECGTGQKSTSHRITCICSHPHPSKQMPTIISICKHRTVFQYCTLEIQSSTLLHPSIQT